MTITEKAIPQTNGGRMLKRGDTRDIECWRTSHRLSVGQGILRNMGLEQTWPEHDEKCIKHPSQRFNRCFGVNYWCECHVGTDPHPQWSPWATGKMFDLAYQLADEVQTERGHYNQNAAFELKEASRKAAREAVA